MAKKRLNKFEQRRRANLGDFLSKASAGYRNKLQGLQFLDKYDDQPIYNKIVDQINDMVVAAMTPSSQDDLAQIVQQLDAITTVCKKLVKDGDMDPIFLKNIMPVVRKLRSIVLTELTSGGAKIKKSGRVVTADNRLLNKLKNQIKDNFASGASGIVGMMTDSPLLMLAGQKIDEWRSERKTRLQAQKAQSHEFMKSMYAQLLDQKKLVGSGKFWNDPKLPVPDDAGDEPKPKAKRKKNVPANDGPVDGRIPETDGDGNPVIVVTPEVVQNLHSFFDMIISQVGEGARDVINQFQSTLGMGSGGNSDNDESELMGLLGGGLDFEGAAKELGIPAELMKKNAGAAAEQYQMGPVSSDMIRNQFSDDEEEEQGENLQDIRNSSAGILDLMRSGLMGDQGAQVFACLSDQLTAMNQNFAVNNSEQKVEERDRVARESRDFLAQIAESLGVGKPGVKRHGVAGGGGSKGDDGGSILGDLADGAILLDHLSGGKMGGRMRKAGGGILKLMKKIPGAGKMGKWLGAGAKFLPGMMKGGGKLLGAGAGLAGGAMAGMKGLGGLGKLAGVGKFLGKATGLGSLAMSVYDMATGMGKEDEFLTGGGTGGITESLTAGLGNVIHGVGSIFGMEKKTAGKIASFITYGPFAQTQENYRRYDHIHMTREIRDLAVSEDEDAVWYRDYLKKNNPDQYKRVMHVRDTLNKRQEQRAKDALDKENADKGDSPRPKSDKGKPPANKPIPAPPADYSGLSGINFVPFDIFGPPKSTNAPIPGLGGGPVNPLLNTLVDSAQRAGVDPRMLATFAQLESGMGKHMKNRNSSATGAFQFIDSTWKEMLNQHGAKYGMTGDESRMDNRASSLMGAEFLKKNMGILQNAGVSDVNSSHLYLAHVLGGGGASKFLTQMQKNPNTRVSDVLSGDVIRNNAGLFNTMGRNTTLKDAFSVVEKRVSDSEAVVDRLMQSHGHLSNTLGNYALNQMGPTVGKPMASNQPNVQVNSSPVTIHKENDMRFFLDDPYVRLNNSMGLV